MYHRVYLRWETYIYTTLRYTLGKRSTYKHPEVYLGKEGGLCAERSLFSLGKERNLCAKRSLFSPGAIPGGLAER